MTRGKIMALAAVVTAAFATGPAMAGDAENGMKVFKKCVVCHTVEKDGKNKVGPNLFGVVGRSAGKADGFKYSKAMHDAGVTWDEGNLDQYLEKPKDFIPKNKMAFAGLKGKGDRDDVIAYLKTLQ